MDTATTEIKAPNQQRLNPFAFPSETNVRFTLLIIAALMLALYSAETIGSITGLIVYPDIPASADLSDPASIERELAESIYVLTQLVEAASVQCVVILSVLILAAVIYRSHASRIRRAKNLKTMSRGEDAPFFDAIQAQVSLSGLSPSPSIELANGSRSVEGQAFGFRKQYALGLGGRLRLLLRQSPESFRAIILHELGHIVNADVGRAYFAQAIWSATVIFAAIPSVVSIAVVFIQHLTEKLAGGLTHAESVRIFTLNVPTVLVTLFQIGGTLAIVAAIRSNLLRVREIYADWRAGLWGAGAALSDVLARQNPEDKTRRWARLWRLHPTPQERLDTLQNPVRLFRVTTELPFFVGVLLPYVLSGANSLSTRSVLIINMVKEIVSLQLFKFNSAPIYLWGYILIYDAIMATSLALGILVLGLGVYLVAGALGAEVQRETVADMTIGKRGWIPYLKLWKPAALVAIGIETGILLTPFSFLGLLPTLINARGLIVLLMMALFIIGVTFLTWLWMVYVRFFARRTLGSHVGTTSSQRARRLLTLASGVLLVELYLPALIGDRAIMEAASGVKTLSSLLSPFIGSMPTLVQLLGFFFVTVAITLFLYVVAFGTTWLSVQAYQLVRRPHCPACKKVTRQQYAVGQVCEHCASELAPWLYVN